MKSRTHLLLFLLIFAFESNRVIGNFGNAAPPISDLMEVHNIAFNLAQGRGYQFDWDNPVWRASLGENAPEFILARQGNHPTMFRPPLAPVIVATLIKFFPNRSFIAWRVFDCAAFSLGVCVLCDIAYVLASPLGLVVMLVTLLTDPLLRTFVPGCWTEGLAFDLLCVIAWLIANPGRVKLKYYCVIAGAAVGLLCLDRAIFILMSFPLCVLLAVPLTSRVKNSLIIFVISIVIQMPWWVRNVEVSGRFLPLGTQGGYNLPDEYGDVVFEHRGWTGLGIGAAWTPLWVNSISVPRGFTEQRFMKLDGNRRMQAVIAAGLCGSLESEIAVTECGRQTAWSWIKINYRKIPALMLLKVEDLTAFFRTPLIVAGSISLIGFATLPTQRWLMIYLCAIAFMYVGAVSLTHVVLARFLIPILPPLYLGIAFGVCGIARTGANLMRSSFLRKLQ